MTLLLKNLKNFLEREMKSFKSETNFDLSYEIRHTTGKYHMKTQYPGQKKEVNTYRLRLFT